MQLLHMPGFVNRVVYNACKAYADQLEAGERHTKLADVVAISICDFALWPDAQQDAAGEPRVPMLSRWNMTEQASGHQGLLQVQQYAFLELPKLPEQQPETGADLWAWLFVHAPELDEMPVDLPEGPHREAVELANEATFTQAEFDAYRRVMAEIDQAIDWAAAQRAEGAAEGRVEGRAAGKAEAILQVLMARGVAVDEAVRDRIEACTDLATLARWLARAVTAAEAEEVVEGS